MATMPDPAHPGESLRDALAAAGWTVTEAAAKLGCARQTFSRLLNGRTGISPGMALALERIGLEQRGVLGAAAGAVRLGAGTHPPAAGGGMNGAGVRPRRGGSELPVEHPPPRVVVGRRRHAPPASERGRVTPHAFITKWRASELKERSASQEHFLDLWPAAGGADAGRGGPDGRDVLLRAGRAEGHGRRRLGGRLEAVPLRLGGTRGGARTSTPPSPSSGSIRWRWRTRRC